MGLSQDNLEAAFRRAHALQQAARWDEAVALWREVLAREPGSAEARVNLGGVLIELGAFEAAEAELRQAVAARPDAAWSHYNLGRLMLLTKRWPEAEAAYRAALAAAPDDPKARLGLAHAALAQGDLATGWPLYEARTEIPSQNAPKLDLPNEWRGEPVAGKRLLVWPEQGFGDQIQFARFAPALRDLGAEVTLVAPPPLTALFEGLGVAVIEQQAGPMSVPAFDAWTLLLSIPGRLGTTLETIPQPPYLAPPVDRAIRWAGQGAGKVGVVWRGRPTGIDAHRSLPGFDALAPLAEAGADLLDLSDPIGDFADLAAVISELDLLVTVDTAAAHLAGAMGKPAFVLLPWFRTDWRWLEGRADSPWYPSLRLFRQPAFGQWEPVIAEVAAAYGARIGG